MIYRRRIEVEREVELISIEERNHSFKVAGQLRGGTEKRYTERLIPNVRKWT